MRRSKRESVQNNEKDKETDLRQERQDADNPQTNCSDRSLPGKKTHNKVFRHGIQLLRLRWGI